MVGVMAIIGDLIPPRERGKYQGMMAAVMTLAMIGGPLVSDTVTDHWDWRRAFYINLPLGVIALALFAVVPHLPKKRAKAGIDYLGVVLLTVGITSIVLTTTWGGTEYAWTSAQITVLTGIDVAAPAGFVFWQTRAAEPVMPLCIFRSRNFTLMPVITFIVGFVMFGATLYLPLYQQSVQGASATKSGLLPLPMLGAMLVISVVAGRVSMSTGKCKVFPLAGSVLMAVGLYLLSSMDTETSRVTSGLFTAVVGLGMGCPMQVTMLVAQNGVEAEDMGVASSSNTLFRALGSSFGVAIMGALFNNRVQYPMSEQARATGSRLTR